MDGSPKSEAGLEYALDTYPNAGIVVLYVMTPYDFSGEEDPPLPPELAEEWHQDTRERAEAIFEEARGIAAEHDAEIETALDVGDPWRAIVEYAGENDIDHVVMGSHGRADESALPLGSVAEAVMRRSPVLVTIVR